MTKLSTSEAARVAKPVLAERVEATRYTPIGIGAVAAAVRCQRMPAPRTDEWTKTEVDLWDHVVVHDDDAL